MAPLCRNLNVKVIADSLIGWQPRDWEFTIGRYVHFSALVYRKMGVKIGQIHLKNLSSFHKIALEG